MENEVEESEFGKGFAYCLGLFLAHAEREVYQEDYSLWFSGASDHLYELEIPEVMEPIAERITIFQDKCLDFRNMFGSDQVSREDKIEMIQEAKSLLREYDARNGVDVIRGRWE